MRQRLESIEWIYYIIIPFYVNHYFELKGLECLYLSQYLYDRFYIALEFKV